MIEQNVQVVRCQDERLWVRIGSRAGCSACSRGEGCGAGVFAKLMQRKPVILELARNDIKVEAGQMLTLAFPERLYIKVVFALYGWPLLAALAGAMAGYSLSTWLNWTAVMVDAGTLGLALLMAWVVQRLLRNQNRSETILGSLQMTNYYPSGTPDQCRAVKR